jgi:hypothetical protein
VFPADDTSIGAVCLIDTCVDDFVDAWTTGVLPLREKYGFTFHGAWAVDETNEFIWVLGHADTKSFESANRGYYESDARKSLNPDPAQFIAEVSKLPARPVLQKAAYDGTYASL